MSTEIRMVSSNKYKLEETQTILSAIGVTVIPHVAKVEELQTTDTERLVKDKALKAFDKVGRPLFVEHTGLYLDYMNGLPGGLTQIVWDQLQADRFAQLFGGMPDTSVTARTTLCYLDGRTFQIFHGEVKGTICNPPRGPRDFQWDCVFVPDQYPEHTFAELGAKKNEISMRWRALDRFASFLRSRAR